MMKRFNNRQPSGSHDFWEVSQAATYLAGQACTLSARHIRDGMLRLQFNREVAYYAQGIVRDVEAGKTRAVDGLKAIKEEQKSLLGQSYEIGKKGVGVAAGALQFAGGAGVCYASVGTLCLVFGVPMMAHGANNIYENGHNLINDRSDAEGPLRKGYQQVSKWVGGSEFEGNMGYGSADLLMSGYGISRLVLKPEAWRLFRYVRTDYVRGIRKAAPPTFIIERGGDALTAEAMHDQWKIRRE